jgi:hypothetical protein
VAQGPPTHGVCQPRRGARRCRPPPCEAALLRFRGEPTHESVTVPKLNVVAGNELFGRFDGGGIVRVIVTPYVPIPGQGGGVGGEVSYLAAAHRALIDQAIEEQKAQAPRSYWKWLETFYANNKGLTWLCTAILVPIIGFAWHYFFN